MHLKLLQKEQFKTAEATDNLIGNKIADRITKVLKTSPKNNSETNEEEILWERFIPWEVRHKTIDDLRLKKENYWWFLEIIIDNYNRISKCIRQHSESAI